MFFGRIGKTGFSKVGKNFLGTIHKTIFGRLGKIILVG